SGSAGRHALSLRGYASRETATYYSGIDDSRYVSSRLPTRWVGAQLQDVLSYGPHSLTAGVDYNEARAETEAFSAPGERAAPYSPNTSIASAAAFAQGRLSFLDERLTATLGARLDRIAF